MRLHGLALLARALALAHDPACITGVEPRKRSSAEPTAPAQYNRTREQERRKRQELKRQGRISGHPENTTVDAA